MEEEDHEPPAEPRESAAETPAAVDAGTAALPTAAPAEPEAEGNAEPDAPPQTQREVWLEVGVVLLVTLFLWYCAPLLHLIWPKAPSNSFSLESQTWRLLYGVPECTFILYVISRSGESWAHFGMGRVRWKSDTVLFVVTYFATRFFVSHLLDLGGKSGTGGMSHDNTWLPATLHGKVVVASSVLVSAFKQELLMRGYLIPRLERLLGSTWVSVVITALLFGGFHMYQGNHGVVQATLVGCVYGSVFAFTRRLWPVAGAHAAHNLWVHFS